MMSDDMMMKNGEKKTFSPLLFFFVGGHHRPCTTIPPNYWSRRLKSIVRPSLHLKWLPWCHKARGTRMPSLRVP